jgi:hypothetical protein
MIAKGEAQRTSEASAKQKGGTGTRRPASPDPRTATDDNRKSRSVG